MPVFPPLPEPPLQPLRLAWLARAGVEAAVLRLDLIDPLISGNKWFKLAHPLQAMAQAGLRGVISLGGAYSNHLHALAAAGQRLGFETVGLVRGHPVQTPTVADLQAFGMQLHWLGYDGYRQRHAPGFWAPWQARYPHLLPVAEGAGGDLGARGCEVLREYVDRQLAGLGWSGFEAWWLAVGTGTTLAGIVRAEQGRVPVHGAMAVPAGHGVESHVQALLGVDARGYHLHEASAGGFAKTSARLLDFIDHSEVESGMPLEPVYTGKALLALHDHVAAGAFTRGTRVVFVHTGGLQGKRGAGPPRS